MTPLAAYIPSMTPLAAESSVVEEIPSMNTRQQTVPNVTIQNPHNYYWFSSIDIIELKEVHTSKCKVKDRLEERVYPGYTVCKL